MFTAPKLWDSLLFSLCLVTPKGPQFPMLLLSPKHLQLLSNIGEESKLWSQLLAFRSNF